MEAHPLPSHRFHQLSHLAPVVAILYSFDFLLFMPSQLQNTIGYKIQIPFSQNGRAQQAATQASPLASNCCIHYFRTENAGLGPQQAQTKNSSSPRIPV